MDHADAVLVWEAQDTTCASADALRAAITERLGYDPVRPNAARVFRAQLHHRGARYTLSVHEGNASRKYSGDCEDVLADAALAIAMALDPLHTRDVTSKAESEEPPPAMDPPAQPPATQPSQATDTSKAATRPAPIHAAPITRAPRAASRPRALWFVLGAHGGVSVGQTPLATARFGIELGIERGPWLGVVRVQLGLPTTQSYTLGGQRVETSVASQTLGFTTGWWFPLVSRTRLAPILEIEIDRLSSQGYGADVNRSANPLLAHARAGARLAWQVHSNLSLFAQPTVGVALGEARMLMQTDGRSTLLWTSPPVSVQALAGVSLRFGR